MRFGSTFALGLLLALGTSGYRAQLRPNVSAPSYKGEQPPPAPTVRPTDRFRGVILSERSVDVAARAEGVIVDLPVEPGDRVAAGALIAQLDAAKVAANDVRLAELDAQAADEDRRRLKLEVDRAAADKARVATLASNQLLSAQDSEATEYSYQIAQARLRVAEAAASQKRAIIDHRRILLDDTRVAAPFAGVISIRYVALGSLVSRGTAIARLVDLDRLIVRFAVPLDKSKQLRIGDAIDVFIDDLRLAIQAVVSSVRPEVDIALQVVIMEGRVDRSVRAASSDVIVGRSVVVRPRSR